jgi:hypothetical protein
MFERFTHAARDAVTNAQTEARTLQHPQIGTEHLLLALLRGDQQESDRRDGGTPPEEAGLVALLAGYGITAETVRTEIIRRAGAGTGPERNTEAEDAEALRAIGIDLDAVRQAIERNFGPGALHLEPAAAPRRRGLLSRVAPGHRPFSDQAKKSLELALREAIALKHRTLTPEHLLLGILREGQGLGARILRESGVDPRDLRAAVVATLRHPAA